MHVFDTVMNSWIIIAHGFELPPPLRKASVFGPRLL